MRYSGCRDCGTLDPMLLYRSGRMQRCHDCQHYENLTRKGTGGGVEFTREQFVEWRLTNIVPCCGPCNAIKGSILTHAEMRVVGSVLATLWSRRLTDATSGPNHV
jgi:hypothetical protein